MEDASCAGNARSCAEACLQQPQMTLEEVLSLSPWEKWARFGRFPFKMATHLLLVAIVTYQAVGITQDYSHYSRSVGRNWVNLFFPEDYQDFQTDYNSWNQYNIFTQNDVVEDAQRLVDIYYELPTLSVDSVYVTTSQSKSHNIPTPYMTVEGNGHEKKYDLYNSSSGWPLAKDSDIVADEEKLVDFFEDLQKMRFYFVVKSDGGYEDGRTLCLLWDVHFTYNLQNRAQIEAVSTYKPRERCGADVDKRSTVYVLCYVVVIAAFFYQFLLFKQTFAYFEGPVHELDNARNWWLRDSFEVQEDVLLAPIPQDRQLSILDYDDLHTVWTSLTWKEKLGAFNLWLLASTTGNICALVFSFYAIAGSRDIAIHAVQRILVGVACLMYWLSFIQYFEFNPRYYIFINTLKTALPRVGQFLLGILPFFIGYAMVGMTLFGDKSERFGTFFQTIITLFSVVNGDVVRDTFDELAFMPIVSNIYLYVYVLLFSYVCLMTIIAIVEESFFAANGNEYAMNESGDDTNGGAGKQQQQQPLSLGGRTSSLAVHRSRGLSTAVNAADIKGLNRKSVFTQNAQEAFGDDVSATSPHTRQLPPKLRQALRQANQRVDGRYTSESERGTEPASPVSPTSPRMSRFDPADRLDAVRAPHGAFLPTDGGSYVSVDYVKHLLDAIQEDVLTGQSPSEYNHRLVTSLSKLAAKLD